MVQRLIIMIKFLLLVLLIDQSLWMKLLGEDLLEDYMYHYLMNLVLKNWFLKL